ncbi:hypothetical protein JCM11641_001236 [Rhodosporidiobolus odoratus]
MSSTEIELQDCATTLCASTPPSKSAQASQLDLTRNHLLQLSPATTRVTTDEEPPEDREAFEIYPENAWGQVLACFVLFSTTLGGVYSWGVLQDALVAKGVAPSSTLAWVGSTQATLEAVLAVPCSRLVAAYGPRRVALAGSVFCAVGPLLASFCTNSIAGLVLTEGILFGTGQALAFFASATLPSMYFNRRRNIATGFVYSGAGIGGGVFSIISAQLLRRLSIAWTFRTIGLIFAVLNVPAALALRTRAPKEPLRSGKKVLDWSLFKDMRFTLLLIGTSIGLFPLFVPPFFLPLYGSSIGLSASTSSLILAGFNFSSATGRIGFGLGADSLLGSLNALVLCLSLVGVSTLVIWPLATTLPPLVAFAVINGFCAGGMFSLIPGTLSSVFGSRSLSIVFSMIVSAWTPGYFLGAPIAGYLLEAFGGSKQTGYGAYRPAIFYSGGMSLFAAFCVLAVRVKMSRQVFRKV